MYGVLCSDEEGATGGLPSSGQQAGLSSVQEREPLILRRTRSKVRTGSL